MDDAQAIAVLSAPGSYASMRSIEPDGISMSFVPQKSELRAIYIFGTIIGLACLFAGIYLHRHPPADFQQGPMAYSGVKLIAMSCFILALLPAIALIRLVNGPPRTVEIEVVPGRLKADRSIGGDRVVSTYGIDEVPCLFVEGSMLHIETRKGQAQLIMFGQSNINEAAAFLIARRFWFPLEIEVSRSRHGLPGYYPLKRVVFRPKTQAPQV